MSYFWIRARAAKGDEYTFEGGMARKNPILGGRENGAFRSKQKGLKAPLSNRIKAPLLGWALASALLI